MPFRSPTVSLLASALFATLVACGGEDPNASTVSMTKSTQDTRMPADTEEDTGSSGGALASDPAADPTTPSDPADPTSPADPLDPGSPAEPAPSESSAGPKPTQVCNVTKDGEGFITRSSSLGSYVAYVPSSYDGTKPMRAVIGMHGCGDNALNFATWGMAPYDTRATQDHIAISVGSETGSNKCWSMGNDDAKVLAALDDMASCFWIHQKKVTIAGFSSGGQLAYRVGMMHADRFAGILIENSTLSAGGNPDTLLAGAARKIPVAHRAHASDTVFPLATVEADWAKIQASGHPLETSVVAGAHDGNSGDWTGFLLPRSATFLAP